MLIQFKLVKGSVAEESIHMSHLTLRAHMNGIYHYTYIAQSEPGRSTVVSWILFSSSANF